MSDTFELPPPFEPGTPEYSQYLRAQVRGPLLLGQNVATGVGSLFTLPGQDVQPSTAESWTPGVVSRVGGGILGLGDAISNILDRGVASVVPGATVRPPTPWVTRLNQLGESTRKHTEDLVQYYTGLKLLQPENEVEQVAADVGDTAGLMAAPVPGSAVAKLPSLVQKGLSPILHVLTPLATEHKVAPFLVGAGLTSAQDVAAEAQAQQQQSQQPQFLLPPPAQPDDTAQAAPQAPPATPAKLQFSLPSSTSDQQQFSLPSSTATQQNPSADALPQPQTGESPISWPAVVGTGAALLLPFAGLRYGRPFLERGGLAGPADRGPGTPYDVQRQANEQFRLQPNPDFTSMPDAPLSVAPAQAAAARVQAAAQDRTALLRAHVANTADPAGEAVAHEIGDVNNQAAQQARVDSYMATGLHKASGVQTIAPQEILLNHGRLNADGQQIVNDALSAKSELDHRTNVFNQDMRSGKMADPGYDPLSQRRYFRTTDDATLRQMVRTAEVSPDTNQVLQDTWQMTRGNLDILRAMGYPTDVINDIARLQPHYVPSMREDGTPVHILGPRQTDTYSGPLTPPGRAMDAIMMHQEGLMKLIENDTVNRKIIDSDAQAKANDPNHAAMFSLKATPSGDFAPGSSEPSVVIPRVGGWETHLIHNIEIAQAMHESPPVKAGALQAIRNQFTRYTTGPGALATAMKFFPAIHGLTRGPYLQNLNTTPDMYANFADRLAKRAGAPNNFLTRLSPDPWLMAPAMAATRLHDAATHAISNMLMPTAGNPGNQALRHYMGDASVDALRQRLINRYRNSLTYDWKSRGGANSGNYGQMLVGADQTSRGGQRVVNNPAATLAPRAITPKSPLGKVMPYATNINNLVREVFDSFMEAPNMYSFALNRDNPNITGSRLTNEARGVLGDPGKQGGGAAAKGVIRNLPYTNATIQDLARAGRAKYEQPATRAMARSILLTTGAAASVYTAMHTPGGLSHLLNLVSTNQLASGPQLYNGNNTDSTTPINLPQSERMTYPFHLDAVLHMVNAWNAHRDEATFERMYHTLASMFSAHVYNNTVTAAGHGASQQVDPFLGVNPGVTGLITAITGQEPRLQVDRLIDRWWRNRPLQLSAPVAPQAHAPNVAGEDSVFGAQEGKKLEGTLSGIFGLGSDLLETIDRGYSSLKHGEGLSTAVGRMLDNMHQHFKDQNQSFNNILWDNSTKLSTSTPLVENTNKALDVMRDTKGAKSDIAYAGLTRPKSGIPLSGEGEQKMQSHDPIMQNMRLTTQKVMDIIDTKLMPRVTDIKKLDNDLNNVQMSEDARRIKHNEYVREINEAYIPIAKQVARLNENLSRLAGKKIDISQGRIDWTRGADQFK